MMRRVLDETSRGEKDFDITHRLLMPDGSVKFVHVLSRVLKDATDNLEIAGALMDVTENTRLYRDLAEREAKIRRLVEANIIGVFLGGALSHLASKGGLTAVDRSAKVLESLNPAPAQR
jgi:hypothetical protein